MFYAVPCRAWGAHERAKQSSVLGHTTGRGSTISSSTAPRSQHGCFTAIKLAPGPVEAIARKAYYLRHNKTLPKIDALAACCLKHRSTAIMRRSSVLTGLSLATLIAFSRAFVPYVAPLARATKDGARAAAKGQHQTSCGGRGSVTTMAARRDVLRMPSSEPMVSQYPGLRVTPKNGESSVAVGALLMTCAATSSFFCLCWN